MKKSQAVALGLMTVLASACGDDEKVADQRCVDDKNQVVADSLCKNGGYTKQVLISGHSEFDGHHHDHSHYHPVFYPYFWYYGGGLGYGPGNTIIVNGGSRAPSPGVSYRSRSGYVTSGGRSYRPGTYTGNAFSGRSATSRGGFGSIGAGRSSFGG